MSKKDIGNQSEVIADRVVADPGNLPDVNVFVGWIGRSGRDGIVRIYLRFDFSSYIEVADSDVVYVKHPDTELGFSILWVRRSARLHISESDADVVRAWKDRDYRDRLSEAQLAALPGHPAGAVSMPGFLLGGAVAGSPFVCTADSTFAWTCCPVKISAS